MTFGRKILAGSLLLLGATFAQSAQSASPDGSFRAAVARVLESARQDTDYLKQLSNSDFKKFVSCAQGVMDHAVRPDKEYVLAAHGASDQRKRFDEVASKPSIDRKQTLKQQVSSQCAM
jgi:hypothetical protein